MLPKKLKYQRCPNCKEYGLPAWNKTYRNFNPTYQCPYCKNFYKVNIALSTGAKYIVLFLMFLFLFLFEKLFSYDMPFIIYIALALFSFTLMVYLLPYEKRYDDEVSKTVRKKAEKKAEDILIELRTEQVISKKDLCKDLLINYLGFMILTYLFSDELAKTFYLKDLVLIVTVIHIIVSIVCFIWRDKAEKKWKSKRTSTYEIEAVDTEEK